LAAGFVVVIGKVFDVLLAAIGKPLVSLAAGAGAGGSSLDLTGEVCSCLGVGFLIGLAKISSSSSSYSNMFFLAYVFLPMMI